MARINSLSGYSNSTFATITNLAATGSNLQTQINNLDLTYATDASVSGVATNLATTGSTLNTKIDNLSGYSNNTFATITNLASTGSTLNSRINSLSGTLTGDYLKTSDTHLWSKNIYDSQVAASTAGYAGRAGNGSLTLYASGQNTAVPSFYGWDGFQNSSFTAATARTNLGLTSTATQPENTFVRTTGDQTVSGIKNFTSRPTVNGTGVLLSGEAATPQNLATTGSTLTTSINSLSGTVTGTYATITNLATTGSTLNTRINNLSGYINSTGSNIVFTTGNQTITGQKIFQDKLLVGLTTPDAATPDNILQTNSLTIAGVDITAGGQVPSTVIKGATFLGKSDGSAGILTNTLSTWGPEASAFEGVNFDVTAYNNIYFSAGYFPQFWLDTNGNVGIQTAYPSERLEVNGNVLGNNLVYNTGDQTVGGFKTFQGGTPLVTKFVPDGFGGAYGLEVYGADEPFTTNYGSTDIAIGVSTEGFVIKYGASDSDWGQPILLSEGGTTVVHPASTITFPQPLLAPNLVYSSGDYNYFTTSITLGNSYINLANSTSGITATLPSIASGRNYIVKNLNTGTLTVTGSNFIDGNVNLKLYKNESAHLLGVNNVGFTGWVSLNTNPGIS